MPFKPSHERRSVCVMLHSVARVHQRVTSDPRCSLLSARSGENTSDSAVLSRDEIKGGDAAKPAARAGPSLTEGCHSAHDQTSTGTV